MSTTAIASVLTGSGTEMFTNEDGKSFISHDMTIYSVKDAPEHVKAKLLAFIKAKPAMEKAYEILSGSKSDDAKIEQCIKCRFANLDGIADISSKGSIQDIEVVSCPKRGTCKFEGIGCNKLNMPLGIKFSKSELRVLPFMHLEEKQIADKLFLSHSTIKRHSQNIRFKTGIPTGKVLSAWAVIKGFINHSEIC